MRVPFKYITRNFKARKLTTIITITGIALVVFVFTAVLMMAYGIQKTLKATGSSDNVLVSRKSASGEIVSIVEGDVQNIIKTFPYIAKNQKGEPIVSTEPVAIINLEIKTGGLSNITVRGVSEPIFDLRPQAKVLKGRTFTWGAREVIVGTSIEKKYKSANVGDSLKIWKDYWKVVGVFTADESGFDSEIWGDSKAVLNALNRENVVSTVTFKMKDTADFAQIKQEFKKDRRLLQYEPEREQRFFEKQSEMMAVFIRILGLVITIIFSVGATIGAMITMYAAVANRTVEIGTMRALGFSRTSILSAFLLESLLVSLIAWAAGVIIAQILTFQKVSTLNFGTFADLEFSFSTSPEILIYSLIFALLMGFFGGFLPAFRAARMKIVNALRAL
jgi:ABC-type antimicrobial peptide transport system permease subunit